MAGRLAANQPVRIVLYGDSISEVGRTPGYFGGASRPEMNWGKQLQALLANEFPGRQFIVESFGIGGQNTYEGLGRLDWLDSYQADLVLIAFGANDCGWHPIPPESTQTAMTSLVEGIQFRSGSDVVIVGAGGDNPADPLMTHLAETLDAERKAAEAAGVPFVDLRRVMLDLTDNGKRWEAYHNGIQDCHPNDRGHGIWAVTVCEAIKRSVH